MIVIADFIAVVFLVWFVEAFDFIGCCVVLIWGLLVVACGSSSFEDASSDSFDDGKDENIKGEDAVYQIAIGVKGDIVWQEARTEIEVPDHCVCVMYYYGFMEW